MSEQEKQNGPATVVCWGTEKKKKTTLRNYRNRFVTQYITYLNIWEALSGTLSTNDQLILF